MAKPIAPAPPVTSATCPASGDSFALPSFACSRLQYSMSNRSASGSGVYRPIELASALARSVCSAMSAAMRASFFVRPVAKIPTPGTRMTRGELSSLVTDVRAR